MRLDIICPYIGLCASCESQIPKVKIYNICTLQTSLKRIPNRIFFDFSLDVRPIFAQRSTMLDSCKQGFTCEQ